MKANNFGPFHIRKWYLQVEDTLATDFGVAPDGEPVRKIMIAAAIHNPYAGKHVEDLNEAIKNSEELGVEFGRRIQEVAAGMPIESYGKACVIGEDGEYEHGNALLTTTMATPLRAALGGALAWIPSTGKKGSSGVIVDIPLAHKDALYVRSHYDTMTVTFSDGPLRDEVIIAMAFATRGRLHARLGGIKASEIEGKDGLN